MKTEQNGKPVDLGFGHLGNGITVYDRTRQRHGDYLILAHIDKMRVVKYYKDVTISTEQKQAIEHYAKTAHPNVSITQDEKVFVTEPTL